MLQGDIVKEIQQADKIARLKLVLTTACNLNCDYCFEGDKGDKQLDSDGCIALGYDVLSNMKQDHLTIFYYGGEPLLMFKAMQFLSPFMALKAKKLGKTVSFSTITNGTIFNRDVVSHMAHYQYDLTVSYDLHPRAFAIHRGDRALEVLKNIKSFLSYLPSLCVSAVITRQNIVYALDGFMHMLDMGVKNFSVNPVTDNYLFTPEVDEYAELMKDLNFLVRRCEGITLNPHRRRTADPGIIIEYNPLNGVSFVTEKESDHGIDFRTGGRINKVPPSDEIIKALREAEGGSHDGRESNSH